MTPEEKFNELKSLFKRLSDEMCLLVEAFYAWKALVFSRSVLEIGEAQANKNAAIMQRHSDFFQVTEYSLLNTLILGASKFYDKHPKALSFDFLIQKLRESKDDITADLLEKIRPGTVFFSEEERNTFESFKEEDALEIDALRQKNESVIKNLKIIRDKSVAHTDIIPIKGAIIPNEVEQLITDTQEIFNKLSRFDRSTTMWDHLGDHVKNDVTFILENLERGENDRQREMDERWGRTTQ